MTAPISPFPIALPPVEFDHPYTGKLTVLKQDDYVLIREVCRDFQPYRLLVPHLRHRHRRDDLLPDHARPDTWTDERALRHEMGHCNGWSSDHPGARYGD